MYLPLDVYLTACCISRQVCGALALAVADVAVAVGAGPGAKVLQEVQAPDLSRRQDGFAPNSPPNTFVVSADLRPSASVFRPADQRPVFDFPQQQQPQQQQLQQQQVISRPPPPPQAGPPVRPQGELQNGPQPGSQFRPQVDQPLQKPVSPATDAPVLDKATVEVREIHPPFLQQFNEDGTIYRPPPPTAPPPQQQQQQFRRPPPRFRRPRPPFVGRPQLPRPGSSPLPRPGSSPLPRPGSPPLPRPGSLPLPRPGRPVRPRPPGFHSPLQRLQQRIFGRPPARAAPLRRRSRRDLTADVTAEIADAVSPDVKQDRLGKWEMEYAMRKAADPASLKDNDDVPLWAPLKPEARARLAQLAAESATSRDGEEAPANGGVTVTEVVADSVEVARIPISAGDEVVIVRVPEEKLSSEPFTIESSQVLSYRDGRARRIDAEENSEDSTGRSSQPWWARIPVLGSLIYNRELPGEKGTPGYTPNGEAAPAAPSERTGYDPDPIITPLYDPYLSVDGNGKPYYRTPLHAQQAHYEYIPDVEKPVLNPTDEYVVPDNIEDPFRGGYAPFRPGFQYTPRVPYLPSPYYPPGDVKYHRRQLLFPEPLEYIEISQKKREDEGTEVKARQAETVKAVEVENDESDLGRVLAQATQDGTGELAIIDTGEHYAVISGDINKFVSFDGQQGSLAKSTKARSLADLLKLSESSDGASAAHSRTKRQSGLYPLLAPVRRRPQRRPIQRRDDVGRFPPRVPAFRPPWESGRRVPARHRGPRPLRPVSQRPNTRQPTTSFQPPAPRPGFEQHEARPVFDQPQERPVFDQPQERPVFNPQEERPSFEQQNIYSFEQPQEGPEFQTFNARPSFEEPSARPEFEQPAPRPTFHEPASRPVVEQPDTDIIAGPPAQFGGFQPVTGPVPEPDLQLSGSPIVHGEISHQPEPPRPVVSPLRQDAPRLTVVTTVPTPTHTALFHVQPSRPVPQPPQPATRLVADQQPVPPQQQFASSQKHQHVIVSSSISSQPPVTDNQLTEEADKPSGSWASAALAGLSAILGGSTETTPEPVPIAAPNTEVPAPDVTRLTEQHSAGVPHQKIENVRGPKDGVVYAKDVKTSVAVPQNNDKETDKEQLKEKPTAKVVKQYRKRQRRPSSSTSISGTAVRRNTSRRTSTSTVVHRRRKPIVKPTPSTDSGAAASDVKPAAVTAPKRRVTFGARVRPTSGQRRRRPVARRPTTAEPEPIPASATSTTQEPVTAAATQSVRRPVRRRPSKTTTKPVEAAAPTVATKKPTQPRQTPSPRPVPTQRATQPTTRPATEEPNPTEAAKQQAPVSVDVPSTGGFRPVAGPPRHRPDPPSRSRAPAHSVTTPAASQSENVEDAPSRTRHQVKSEAKAKQEAQKEKDEKEEDVHSNLESYLSRYAEKYGLGLVTSSPSTPAPTTSGRPAAPVSGLRWAHLAGRSRSADSADDDELDEFVTGEPDGDERVSVGSQYSYRVQLPPSRRVPPSLNSVRLRPKSKLAQLLGSSPRLRPSTAKPTIPWPKGYQPFTVSSTTTRPGRWAARRERLTTPTPTPASAPTTGPAWSKYADEFTTTQRPRTRPPSTSGTRSRPIFIPPINRKRIRTRPLTLLHAGPRQPETTTTATTITEQPPVIWTEEPTEAPAVTVPAPPLVTEQVSPELETAPGAEEAETATDSGFEEDDDPLVASSEEPVGESSLFSVVYSKERPHVQPQQPEIFNRLNQFLVANGEQPPTQPAIVSVTVGASPIRVPVSVPVDTQDGQGEFQASVQVVPVEVPVREELNQEVDEVEEPEEQAIVTPDGAVIVRAVPAEATEPSSNGAWVPTVQAVAVAPAVVAASPQPGTVVVYPEHMSQAEREAHWPAQEAEPQPLEEEEEGAWFEEPENVHDLDLSDDDLLEEVVYIEDVDSGAVLGKAARLDDEAAPEAEFLAAVVTDAPATEEDVTEVVPPVHDPYDVFWTSPSGATNAEQAESQQLAGAFTAEVDDADDVDATENVDSDEVSDVPAEPESEVEEGEDDRTVNMCLDGKCMFIYEPGRQVRVSGDDN